MLKKAKIIFIYLFIGVGIFAFMEAVSQFKTNKSLVWQINNTFKPKITQLERDYAQLKKDEARLINELSETKKALDGLEQENAIIIETINEKQKKLEQLQKAQREKEEILSKISRQYTELQGENAVLKEKITAMFIELKNMRQTLSSEKELKKQIRFLRRGGKKKNKLGSNDQLSAQDTAAAGNSGFLMRNGENTYIPKVTISVRPVEE